MCTLRQQANKKLPLSFANVHPASAGNQNASSQAIKTRLLFNSPPPLNYPFVEQIQ
jgi:hypothetical protein